MSENETPGPEAVAAHTRLMRLRGAWRVLFVVALAVVGGLMVYWGNRQQPPNVFVVLGLCGLASGLGAGLAERRCGACGEKFWVVPLSVFYASRCAHCGFDGDGD